MDTVSTSTYDITLSSQERDHSYMNFDEITFKITYLLKLYLFLIYNSKIKYVRRSNIADKYVKLFFSLVFMYFSPSFLVPFESIELERM